MNGWVVLGVVALVFVLLVGFYLSMTAGRLDHLHRRIDMSRLALDAQLLRRSSVCLELASSQRAGPGREPAARVGGAPGAHRHRPRAPTTMRSPSPT